MEKHKYFPVNIHPCSIRIGELNGGASLRSTAHSLTSPLGGAAGKQLIGVRAGCDRR